LRLYQRPCLEVRDIAATHLAQLRTELAELQALERSIPAFVCSCDMACAGGPAIECTILEDLASHQGSLIHAQAVCCPADNRAG
jgi:hypothetical protein